MKTDAALVQASFEHVKPVSDAAAMLLSERLFALAPDTRPMFGDLGPAERAAMMQSVAAVVDGLGDLSTLTPALSAIGGWLARRGITSAHQDRFGDALIWMLGHALGHRFTPDVKAAWKRSYADVEGLMRTQARAAA